MPDCDRARWENWARDVVVEHPARHCYPSTLLELTQIVVDAERKVPPRKVRACGSHWAFSDVAVSPDWFVETHALRGTIYGVIPAALTDQVSDALQNQPHTAGHAYTYYHVEAGITIRDLNLRLDRQSLPPGDRKWAPMPTDEVGDSWAGAGKRWALPTMGAASGQTLAGAISTATHGGEHAIAPLADAVQAIHLVTTGGRQLWIERTDHLTDTDRLARILPDVEQHHSTDLFNAVLVSMGRMGIIYALVLKVTEQFSLEQIITASTWEQEQARLQHPFDVFQQPRPGDTRPDPEPTHFVEVVVLPYARRDSHHSCYVTQRWRGPDNDRRPRRRRDLFGIVCSQRTIRPVVLALIGADLLIALPSLFLPVVGPLLVGIEALLLALLAVLLAGAGHLSVGGLIAAGCNLANRFGQSWLVRRLQEYTVRQFRPRKRPTDVGYEIMDLGLSSGECFRVDALEVAFDATADEHLNFIHEDLFPTFDRVAAAGMTVGGYVSLRFTKESDALLAMQRWDTTCSIEIGLLKGIRGNEQILDTLQAAAIERGGTVHWGQRNTLGAQEVAQMYPQLPLWRTQLTHLTTHGIPNTFDNAFCQARDLEPG